MKRFLLFLSLMAVLVLAAGCAFGGGDESETTPEGTGETTETTDNTAVEGEQPTGENDTAVAEQGGDQTVTIFVGPEQVECTGVAPQTCLQVRLSPDEDYSLFYDTIQGFEFEPGYEYVLQVRVEQIANPPADSSGMSYTLVQVVSKTPATGGGSESVPSQPDGALPTTLDGATWHWESFIDPMGAANIPNSGSLTISFAPDGTLSAQADCNTAVGSYTSSPTTPEGTSGSIQIDIDATTLALCEEGSLGEEFLANLEAVATFTIVDGKLYLDLIADSGTMILGTGQATSVAPPTVPMPSDSLVGIPWQWVSTNDQTTSNPQNYIVEFMADGNVAVKADCNNALGSYTIAAQNIVIQMGPMTMAACPAESLSDQFVANLGMVNSWQLAEGQLRLDMMDGAGTMVFTAVALP